MGREGLDGGTGGRPTPPTGQYGTPPQPSLAWVPTLARWAWGGGGHPPLCTQRRAALGEASSPHHLTGTPSPHPPRSTRMARGCGGIKEIEKGGELARRSCRMRFKQRIRSPAASFRRQQHLSAVGQSAGASRGKCPREDGTPRRVTLNPRPHVSLPLAWRAPATAAPRAAAAARARAQRRGWLRPAADVGAQRETATPAAWRVVAPHDRRGALAWHTVGGARSGGGDRFGFLGFWMGGALLRSVALGKFVGRLAIGW